MGASGSRRGADLCPHLLSPLLVLKSLSVPPSASQAARCRLTSLLSPHPCLSCGELRAKFWGTPRAGRRGGDHLVGGRQAGSSRQRPLRSSMAHGRGREKGLLGLVCSMLQLLLPRHSRGLGRSIERKSRATLGPGCGEP